MGGDILSDKKTLLWLTTLAQTEGREVLEAWTGVQPASGTDRAEAKIQAVRAAMLAAGADRFARERMASHAKLAVGALGKLTLRDAAAAWFVGLSEHVTSRSH